MNKDKIFSIALLFLLLFFTACASRSKSEKSIETLNNNIDNIQNQIKNTKTNMTNVKNKIIKLKKEQPFCNTEAIQDEIEVLDLQINSIDNNMFHIKEQANITKEIVRLEVNGYKQKYKFLKLINVILFIAILIVAIKKLKNILN